MSTRIRSIVASYLAKQAAVTAAQIDAVREALPNASITVFRFGDLERSPRAEVTKVDMGTSSAVITADLSGTLVVSLGQDVVGVSGVPKSDLQGLLLDTAKYVPQAVNLRYIAEMKQVWEDKPVSSSGTAYNLLAYRPDIKKGPRPGAEWSPKINAKVKVLKVAPLSKPRAVDAELQRLRWTFPYSATVQFELAFRDVKGFFQTLSDKQMKEWLLAEDSWLADVWIDIDEATTGVGETDPEEVKASLGTPSLPWGAPMSRTPVVGVPQRFPSEWSVG